MIDGWNFLDQPVKKQDIRTYENIRKNATGHGDACTTGCSTGCSFDCPYFMEDYIVTTIDMIKNNKQFTLI